VKIRIAIMPQPSNAIPTSDVSLRTDYTRQRRNSFYG